MTREETIKICIREKDCVQAALDVCADGGHYVSPDGIITAADYVEAMGLAISALREQPRWISVEERLPTKKDSSPNDSVLAIDIHEGFAREWTRESIVRYPDSFTHWMPLPEGPEVEV